MEETYRARDAGRDVGLPRPLQGCPSPNESPAVNPPPALLGVRQAELKIPALQSQYWFPWQPPLGAFQKLPLSHKLRWSWKVCYEYQDTFIAQEILRVLGPRCQKQGERPVMCFLFQITIWHFPLAPIGNSNLLVGPLLVGVILSGFEGHCSWL